MHLVNFKKNTKNYKDLCFTYIILGTSIFANKSTLMKYYVLMIPEEFRLHVQTQYLKLMPKQLCKFIAMSEKDKEFASGVPHRNSIK